MENWNSSNQRKRRGGFLESFDFSSISKYEIEDVEKPNLKKWVCFSLPKFKPNSLLSLAKNSFKVTGYIMCTVACIYQVMGFIEMYLEYPSTMDVHVEFLNQIDLPAATICNKNWYKRELVCDKFSKHRGKCLNNKLDIDLSTEERNTMSMKTILELSYNNGDIVKGCEVSETPNEKELTEEVCRNTTWFISQFRKCFIYNSQWNTLKDHTPNASSSFKFTLKLDAQEKTYLRASDYPAELHLHIHNSLVLPLERATEPIKVRPGLSYSISITKSTINLLELPFKPGCINYQLNWKREGGKGPLSREGCINECHLNISMQNCGCIASHMTLSLTDNKCTQSQQNKCVNVTTSQYTHCEVRCLSDCQMIVYDLSVSKDFRSKNLEDESEKNLTFSGKSDAQIYMQTRRHMVYQHKPKITPVEILGYVGGYLSLWLGLSIPMVYDFFEIIFIFFIRRRPSKLN